MIRSMLIVLALASPLAADPIAQQDREKLLGHLERTRKIFLSAIEGVSAAQWTYKPAPDRWSIAECAEHIVVTEELLLSMVRDKMMNSPAPTETPANRATDDGILKFITDRSQKAKAPEVLQPKSKYASAAEVKAAFEKARAASAAYVQSTQDPLRSRYGGNFPAGVMDGYQYLLMMAGHSERHTMQLEEVKAAAGYPK